VDAFFPHDATSCEDRIFRHIPRDVRARVLTAWGLRGTKTALRDTDEKVRGVVHDAMGAGDLDAEEFEEGLDAQMVIRHLPLTDWWRFWRAGTLTKAVLGKALTTAYEVRLFDAKWFWETVTRGTLAGTDAVAEGLSKAELTEWLKKVHTSGDGSPAGLLDALGWEQVIARTPNDVLTPVVDALAKKIGLLEEAKAEPPARPTDDVEDEAAPDSASRVDAMLDALIAPSSEPPSGQEGVRQAAPPAPASVDTIMLEDIDEEPTLPPQPIPLAIAEG
jgi:hypothetical protein